MFFLPEQYAVAILIHSEFIAIWTRLFFELHIFEIVDWFYCIIYELIILTISWSHIWTGDLHISILCCSLRSRDNWERHVFFIFFIFFGQLKKVSLHGFADIFLSVFWSYTYTSFCVYFAFSLSRKRNYYF